MGLFRSFLLIFILALSTGSYGAVIIKIKGNKNLIHLEGIEASAGDYFKALNLYGAAVGLIRLVKVKNGKAIGVLVEGLAEPNWILEQTSSQTLKTDTPTTVFYDKSVGFLLSPDFNFISRGSSGGKSRDSLGYGGGGLVFFDFHFHSLWSVNVQVGGKYFSVTERSARSSTRSTNCIGGACKLWMLWFPALKVLGRFHIPLKSAVKLWLELGGDFSFWGSNDENYQILNSEDFSSIQSSIQASIGTYFPLGNMYIPLSLSYLHVQPLGQFFDQLASSRNSRKQYSSVGQLSIYLGIGFQL